jgi:GTP-binding protein
MSGSENVQQKRRVVAIVGRPNVGKSAIFNRLAGKRVAIVHAESGVTRDRLMREVNWYDDRFDLIDTGGICTVRSSDSRDVIEMGIHAQVEASLGDAAVAIIVGDLESGIHPMDEEVAGILHASGVETFVAANKADDPCKDEQAVDFERLGFPVFPVSALHNRGFDDLMEAVTQALPEVENETIAHPLRVVVVGRPNVGKSSYINRLLRNDRVIVADIPGTTRDSIDVPFQVGEGPQARHYVLVDTAGMRRGGKIDTAVERFSLMRAKDAVESADVVVLTLDATRGPSTQDKKIAAYIQEQQKACLILVTKWDLAEQEVTQRQYGPAIFKTMPFMGHCPVVFASAETGFNIRRTIDAIDHVAAQSRTQLPTGVLNRAVQDAYDAVRPPSANGKPLKLYYATQVGVAPIRIRFFVNDPRIVKPQYKTYLVRQLRERFGLEGAPIAIHFTGRKRERKPREGRGVMEFEQDQE